jgi:hypothetical protein
MTSILVNVLVLSYWPQRSTQLLGHGQDPRSWPWQRSRILAVAKIQDFGHSKNPRSWPCPRSKIFAVAKIQDLGRGQDARSWSWPRSSILATAKIHDLGSRPWPRSKIQGPRSWPWAKIPRASPTTLLCWVYRPRSSPYLLGAQRRRRRKGISFFYYNSASAPVVGRGSFFISKVLACLRACLLAGGPRSILFVSVDMPRSSPYLLGVQAQVVPLFVGCTAPQAPQGY